MRKFAILGFILSAVLLLFGISSPANASGIGNQFCYTYSGWACFNAWSGGPWVNVYTGGPYVSNGDFAIIHNYATGDSMLEFTGNSSWQGHCIGDAYNDPGYASTSLNGCGSGGTGAGWGTNFQTGTSGCPSGERWFYNTHWGGYLGPPDSYSNGDHFYLNKTRGYCFVVYPPV